jgi:hypothetical protein
MIGPDLKSRDELLAEMHYDVGLPADKSVAEVQYNLMKYE